MIFCSGTQQISYDLCSFECSSVDNMGNCSSEFFVLRETNKIAKRSMKSHIRWLFSLVQYCEKLLFVVRVFLIYPLLQSYYFIMTIDQ